MNPIHSKHSRGTRTAYALRSLLLGALLATAAGCPGPETPSRATPLADARARENGSSVTVEGYITVAPGAFVSAMGDEGFSIQDSSAGIYVKVAQRLSFALGDRVRVTGTLDEQNRFRILRAEPTDVQRLEGTLQVSPRTATTGSINETNEGLLVRVTGNVTQTFQDDSPYGYKLYINDGSGEVQVFVHVSAGFNRDTLQALRAGQSITVVGQVAQYEDTYEVAPRQPSDLAPN